ncbi:hypothetical protein Dimus_022841, partial [Dionaea muscipula]
QPPAASTTNVQATGTDDETDDDKGSVQDRSIVVVAVPNRSKVRRHPGDLSPLPPPSCQVDLKPAVAVPIRSITTTKHPGADRAPSRSVTADRTRSFAFAHCLVAIFSCRRRCLERLSCCVVVVGFGGVDGVGLKMMMVLLLGCRRRSVEDDDGCSAANQVGPSTQPPAASTTNVQASGSTTRPTTTREAYKTNPSSSSRCPTDLKSVVTQEIYHRCRRCRAK